MRTFIRFKREIVLTSREWESIVLLRFAGSVMAGLFILFALLQTVFHKAAHDFGQFVSYIPQVYDFNSHTLIVEVIPRLEDVIEQTCCFLSLSLQFSFDDHFGIRLDV